LLACVYATTNGLTICLAHDTQHKHMREYSEQKEGTLVNKYSSSKSRGKGVFSVMDKIGEAARKGDINFLKVRFVAVH